MVLFEALIWHSLASGFRAEADGGDAHRHRMRAPAHASELRERLVKWWKQRRRSFMTRTRRCLAYVLLGTLWVAIPALGVASPNLNEQLDPGVLDVGATPRLVPHPKSEPGTAGPAPIAVANPLWAVPLKSLSATRERPLFTPSRRPPAAALASIPAAPAPTPPPSPAVEHPNLTLVGTVHRNNLSIAVFTEPSTKATVRLQTGEGHMGWILISVERNSVILQKGAQTETLALPRTVTAQAEPTAVPATSAASGAAMPVTWVPPVLPNSAGRRP